MKGNSYRARALVMLAVLVVVAVGFFTSFGIGNLCAVGFSDIVLACPLGALLSMIAERTAIPMAVVSVVAALLVCVVLGRVFCSWACPVHFMTHRGNPARRVPGGKKMGKKPAGAAGESGAGDAATPRSAATPLSVSEKAALSGCAACAHPCGKARGIKLDSRHGILAAALASTALFGFPVFCVICPVGLTFATVLLVMRLFAFGETTWTIVAFAAIILAEVFLLPKWCHRFCPLGALLSIFSGANRTLRPQVDATKCLREAGHACTRCTDVCPEGINLHDVTAGKTTLNDCSKCRACADACPEGAIAFPLLTKGARPGSCVVGVPSAEPGGAAGAGVGTVGGGSDVRPPADEPDHEEER